MKQVMTTTALGVVLAVGWGGPADAQIRIGASVSETGPASFLGDPAAKTLRMLIDEINEAGGVLGEQLDLVMYDDQGDASRARTFATRLVEDDGVIAVIGGSTTGTSMAMIPVLEEEQVPFISLAGGIDIIEPTKPFAFKTPHTDRMACEKIFEDMQERGLTRVGMISGTGGFGASMRNQCMDVAGDYDIEIIADESYGPGDADMTPQLTNIRGRNVDAVLNPGFGQGPAIVTRNYAQLGITAPLYQSHGVASNAFIDLAGPEAAEGVRLPGTALLIADLLEEGDPQRQVVHDYVAAYEARFNDTPSTFAGYAHDAMRILVDAIERAGTADGVAVRDAIRETTDFAGTTGIVTMGEDDHLGLDLSAFRMLEIRDGGWLQIE